MDSDQLIFYLPQLLQCLAWEKSGGVRSFLLRMSKNSVQFAHQLLWSLQTEGEATANGASSAGVASSSSSGVVVSLAEQCRSLAAEIVNSFSVEQAAFHAQEFSYVATVTAVSGLLKPVEKPLRKDSLREILRDPKFHDCLKNSMIYLPTNPDCRIVSLLPHTAGAMQSAAKCPILVQFKCESRDVHTIALTPDVSTESNGNTIQNNAAVVSTQTAAVVHSNEPATFMKACIFKMGDDCRQDQVALQLIGFFRRILVASRIPHYLYPYRVVTTGKSSGVIECVPNAMSRDQIGKLVESNLAEYFVQRYGHPESVGFKTARECFITSMASYSVASFVLNIKDRHNGNIMLDSFGHIIHIDFGFIFDFSPGGDMNFESSPFKLTVEMLQLMGEAVSGSSGAVQEPALVTALIDPSAYKSFLDLTIKTYLVIRRYAREICVLVELMLSSGLPCFKPQKTIQDLALRLSLDKTDREAAMFMLQRVQESRDNMRTRLYDKYQNIAEGIEM